MVIENAPRLEDDSPFPTLYWLTCPILIKRLAEDGPLKDRLALAIDRYRERRDGHEVIPESGGPPGGGPDRVKCLHAHAAHELADPPNPIGSIALAEVGWPDCVLPCVEPEQP